MAADLDSELVFVVDVSSFTKDGFRGATTYEGASIEIEFDDQGKGVFLTAEMAKRLKVKKGSQLSVIVEADKSSIASVQLGGTGKSVRISDPMAYYALGKEGGAVLRLRKS